MNARQKWYREYLKSVHWQYFRKIIIKSRGGMCEKCGSFKRLEVHHLNYERLWNEKDGDVMVMCHQCHRKEHGIKKRKTKLKRKRR